ncbi:MAG: glycosyltransferase family 4 protein [Alistipes sp.]|nr:glycosyltransferase family 4 protein [Alistipes sp.]
MKILQVITRSELGGAQTVVVQLANRLSDTHDVVLVAGEGDGKMLEMVSPRVTCVRSRYLQRALSPVKDIRAALELRRIYRKHRPDVIHLHSSKAGTLGRLVFPTKKVVYTVHGFDSIRLAFRKFLPVERILQRACSAIVTVSNYDEKNLHNEGIIHNVSTIYNGITPPDSNSIERLNIANNYKKIVLSIARVNPPKEPKLFIETARLLPQYGFIWIGNQESVEHLGDIPANCHFLGNMVNAGAYCAQADLFMLPSNYEGLPMVIIEAMSCGRPVVASDVGGVSEIVRNDINGYTLPNRAELFAEKIETILSNENLYARMSKSALEIFERELTIDKMVEGYMSVYRSLND